jgi:hypothetical protein
MSYIYLICFGQPIGNPDFFAWHRMPLLGIYEQKLETTVRTTLFWCWSQNHQGGFPPVWQNFGDHAPLEQRHKSAGTRTEAPPLPTPLLPPVQQLTFPAKS